MRETKLDKNETTSKLAKVMVAEQIIKKALTSEQFIELFNSGAEEIYIISESGEGFEKIADWQKLFNDWGAYPHDIDFYAMDNTPMKQIGDADTHYLNLHSVGWLAFKNNPHLESEK